MKYFAFLMLAALSGCVSIPAIDDEKAARIVVLAEAGHAEAQYHVGMFYNNGAGGMSRDPRRAFEWFRKAAAGGDPLGAYKVGCYYAGQFPGAVEADDDKALAMKLVAAEAGYSLAQSDVGNIYYNRRNFTEAVRWWKRATEQGLTGAHYALHTIYHKGTGGLKDPQLAYVHYRLAYKNGQGDLSPDAKIILGYLAEKLSAEERTEADARIAAFFAKPTKLTIAALGARKRVEALLLAPRGPANAHD
jgi:TPR repeat protein